MMAMSPPNHDSLERRLSDARHEYNNISMIVSLARRPAILAQARVLLLALREKYPEYVDDPDGLDDILELKSGSE